MTTINVTYGTAAYVIDGSSNPSISMIRGTTYILEIDAIGHPFWIQTVTGAYSSSNIYSDGVTNNGIAHGTITFVVPNDAPNTLYYFCETHSIMRGTINITDAALPAPAPRPPHIFSMRSIYTNNSQVFYKPNSLSTGSGGSGVRNYRSKQRRT